MLKEALNKNRVKRFFVVSDIHCHYSLLKKVLNDADFDENNKDHIFVCCADLFDRGRENRKVYDYVRNLKHKVLIRGNHDEGSYDFQNMVKWQGSCTEWSVKWWTIMKPSIMFYRGVLN